MHTRKVKAFIICKIQNQVAPKTQKVSWNGMQMFYVVFKVRS